MGGRGFFEMFTLFVPFPGFWTVQKGDFLLYADVVDDDEDDNNHTKSFYHSNSETSDFFNGSISKNTCLSWWKKLI